MISIPSTNRLATDGEINLETGEVFNSPGGKACSQLEKWREREQCVATAMFLASKYDAKPAHLFDLAVAWPNWLKHANSFQHMKILCDQCLCCINEKLGPYGWVGIGLDDMRYDLRPINGATPFRISAEKAIEAMREAKKSSEGENYAAALDGARDALRHCKRFLAAHLLVGLCHFQHGKALPEAEAFDTAKYMLAHQGNLQLAMTKLPELRRQAQARWRSRWACVDDFIQNFQDFLQDQHGLFELFHSFMMGY